MPPLTKTCPKMVLFHKGGSVGVKDAFAKKFFGAGRDSASGTVRGLALKGGQGLAVRFRTIQVYSKDVGMLPRQPRRAVNCPNGFRRGAHALRHKARIHHASRRHGHRVAARGTRATSCLSGDRLLGSRSTVLVNPQWCEARGNP